MSEDEIKPGNFIEEWLKKAKQEKPDSVIVQAIYDATEEGQLNEAKLLLSRGGSDITSNLVLACRKCNSSKRDKDIFYWYAIERQEEILHSF